MPKRDYQNDLPSVTQILGVLRNIGLEQWFKRNDLKTITKESEEGKEIGTVIHDAIQKYISKEKIEIETQYSEKIKTALKSFILFTKDHPEIILNSSEKQVTSKRYGFNGTLDCLGTLNVNLILLDWKVSSAKEKEIPQIYESYLYQISAYVMAYNENFAKYITKAFILAIAKDKIAYNLFEINYDLISRIFEEVFLPCLKIYNFQKNGGLK